MTGNRDIHLVAGETRDGYRWVVLGVTSIGALLAALTSGTLVIALPEILRDLHTDLFTLLWIVVGYTLAATVLLLNAGRIADQVGRARTYTAGFALFTAASIACALAPSAFLLVIARLIQGVGGAFLMANSAALVTDAFPRRELGRALGINAMVVGAGLILGPILGGWLTGFGWQTVFWFNVPIGLIGTAAAATLLVEQGRRAPRAGLDLAGSALYLVGLTGLVTALAFGGIYGWTTGWVLAGFAAFIVAAPAFLWVEAHHPSPLLDLGLFRNRLFALGNLTGLLNGIARTGVLFLLVFYLQGARGYDPVTAGLMLAPLALGLLVLSPISGALADRIGSRFLATLGMLVTAVGLAGLTTIQVDTPYWQLALWQLVIGAGSGLFISPNTSAVMGVVPPAQRGMGSGIRMMLTQTGFVISIALSIGLVSSAMDPSVLLVDLLGHAGRRATASTWPRSSRPSTSRSGSASSRASPGARRLGIAWRPARVRRRGRRPAGGGMTSLRRGMHAFRHRNYRLFFTGQAISLIGTWMQQVAQAWLVLVLTHDPLWLGVVAAAQFIPVMIFGLFAGVLADSLPKRQTLLATQAIKMCLSIIMAILAATGLATIPLLIILALVIGTVNSIDMPVRQAFAVEMVGREDIGNAVALNSAMFNGARIIGPAVAGLVIGAVGVTMAFVVDAASFLAVIVGLAMMRDTELMSPARIARPESFDEAMVQLREGLHYVRVTPAVLIAVVVVGLVSTVGMNFSVIIPPYADEILDSGASGYGFLMAASGVGSLLAALWLAFGRGARIRWIGYGAIMLGVAEVGLGASASYPIALLMMIVVGFGGILMAATANTTMQLAVPDGLRGRVMGVYTTIFAGSTPIGGPMMGGLASLFGIAVSLAIGGVLAVGVGVGSLVWIRRHGLDRGALRPVQPVPARLVARPWPHRFADGQRPR